MYEEYVFFDFRVVLVTREKGVVLLAQFTDRLVLPLSASTGDAFFCFSFSVRMAYVGRVGELKKLLSLLFSL